MASDAQLPGWLDEEPDHLRPILVELIALRRRGVWGLRRGSTRVPLLLSVAKRLGCESREGSQYESIKEFFERYIFSRTSDTDRHACHVYFDITGAYSEDGAEKRRDRAGNFHFRQGISKFRDAMVGAERPFLVRLATAIFGLQQGCVVLDSDIRALLRAQVSAALASNRFFSSAGEWFVEPRVKLAEENLRARHVYFRAALAEHRHIFVTGGPGLGKSTLAEQTVASMSEELASGHGMFESPWLPVYLPARLLARLGTFSQIIADALTVHLAGLLASSLQESIFTEAANGTQGWLLFIDGIDELAVKEQQRLLTVVRHHAIGEQYRFVLLGRTIDRRYIDVVESLSLTHYEIVDFDEWQIFDLCRKCLTAYGAEEFNAPLLLGQARRKGVDELLHNPLLATLICQLFAESPDRSLPNTLLDVYENFVNYLLYEAPGRTGTRSNIRDMLTVYGTAGDRLVDWLYDHRRDLCTYIALETIQGVRRSAVQIGIDFLRGAIRDFPDHFDWKGILRVVLVDTGLFFQQATDLVFVHRTLTEYLAAPVEGLYEVLEIYGEEAGEWYLYQMGDEKRHYANMILMWWSRLIGPRLVFRKLLNSRYELVRYYATEALSLTDLPLDQVTIKQIVSFFSGPYRLLSDEEYLHRRTPYYAGFGWDEDTLELDVIKVLGRLAGRSSKIAEMLLSKVASKNIWYRGKLDALVWLWSAGHRGYAERVLAEFTNSPDEMKLLDAADVYLAVGENETACSIARQAITEPGQIWRGSELLHRCGEREEARHKLMAAFMAADDWDLRIAIVRALVVYFSETEENVADIILQALGNVPIGERFMSTFKALDQYGFGSLAANERRLAVGAGLVHKTLNNHRNDIHFGPPDVNVCRYGNEACETASLEEFRLLSSPPYLANYYWRQARDQAFYTRPFAIPNYTAIRWTTEVFRSEVVQDQSSNQ